MGRAIKNPPPVTVASKLVATGEYVMGESNFSSDAGSAQIWVYNYPKQKGSTETYLYMAAQWNSLEAYSYAPSPVICCVNQTSERNNGSQYYFGYGSNTEKEFNLHSCQNFAHSQSLNGFSANISGANFGVGTVPIEIRWDTTGGGGNRPGWRHCPGYNGGYSGGSDSRGQTNWWGYLRVWEIAY